MSGDHTFRLVMILGFVMVFPFGLYHRVKSQASGEKLDRRQEGAFILLTLRPVGLAGALATLAFMIDPSWMAWSSVPLPAWLRWTGAALGVLAGVLLVWTFRSLGKNLTDTVVTRREHSLVTHGPYRWVRHPFYDCAAMLILANSLLTANWFVFATGVVAFVLIVVRTRREEDNLLRRFGGSYGAYMRRTGRFLPKVFTFGMLMTCGAIAHTPPQPPSQPDSRAMAEAVNRPLVYRVGGEDKVRVRKDLVYRTQPEGTADVYEPAGTRSAGKTPIVVFIHGGVPDIPFRPKDWGIYQGWGRLMAASGFVAVTFNHRLGFPEPFMAEAADDVERLLGYLRSHAAEFGGNADRICLAAYSAGGPLLSSYIREPRSFVRCLAAFYAMLDIRESDFHRKYMKPEHLALFSAAAQVEAHAATMPPMFVMRAGHDRIPGLNAWMETFLTIAIRKNAPITLTIHPTGAHGFENTTDDDRSRQIMRMAIEFIRTHTM